MSEVPKGFLPLVLWNAQGEYVTTAIVPPFQALPNVLTWGCRTFVWLEGVVYQEVFAVAVVQHIDQPPCETAGASAGGG